MGLLARIRGAFAATAPSLPPPAGDPVVTIIPAWKAGRAVPPDGDLTAIAKKYASSAIYACCRELATSAAEPDLVAELDGVRVDDTDRLGSVLARPNDRETTASDFTERIVTDLFGIYGETAIYKHRSAMGEVRQLWPLRMDRFHVIPKVSGAIDHYEFGEGTAAQRIPSGDIIHWKLYNPLNDYRGLSPILVMWLEGLLDADTILYLGEFFRNGGIPAAVLTAQGQVGDKARAKMQEEWREMYGRRSGIAGQTGYGEVAVLSNGATIQPLGVDPSKLDMKAVFHTTESRIAAVLGVPAVVAGLQVAIAESQPYGSWREARRSFVVETLSPLWRRLSLAFTDAMCLEFGRGYKIKYDTRKVLSLQAIDPDARRDATQAYLADGITRDELRSRHGYDPLDEKPVFYSDLRPDEPVKQPEILT